jgi:DNA invertase Pin-like site-specific DNA recombinase
VVKVYKDHACKDAARRQFDVVMAWSVDRLGRSLKDLIGFLSELHALKIDRSCISKTCTRQSLPARPCSAWSSPTSSRR